jgi:flagellar biosynthesis protein FlhB
MTINPKRLFLIDCFGAMLSAFLLGVVMARFERIFGMPQNVALILSIIPCFYALYSFVCFWVLTKNWKPYLRLIAIANLLYCALTAGLVVYAYRVLTIWGFLYFVGEIIVVIGLALVELKTASE